MIAKIVVKMMSISSTTADVGVAVKIAYELKELAQQKHFLLNDFVLHQRRKIVDYAE